MDLSKQKRNIIRNGIWEFISKIVTLFTPFLIRTIIIWKFGVEYLGLNNLFASILQILNMAELGFGDAVVYNLYKPIADNDDRVINALMGFYKKIYRMIGSAILGIGLCIMPFLHMVIKGDIPNGINIYVLYSMSLISTALSYLCFAYRSVLLTASQRKDIISKFYLLSSFFKYSIQIIALFVFGDYYLYFGIDILAIVLNNSMIAFYTHKNFPWIDEKGMLDDDIKKEIFVKVKGLMVYKLSGKTKNAIDSIVLSSFLGLAVVARYGNYYYILNNIIVLLASITAGAQATVGSRLVTVDEETNYSDFIGLTFIHGWISNVCCVCLFCLYQHFMRSWVGGKNMFPFYMVICFCIYFFLQSNCESRNTYINASGLWWENRSRAVGSAVMNLGLNILLVRRIGVLGVIIATLSSVLIFDVLFTSRTLFKYPFKDQNMTKYILWLGKQFFITSVSCVIMYYICTFVHDIGVVGFCLKGIICVAGSNIIFYISYRSDPGFMYLIKVIRKKRYNK